ncbi:ParB/RepB/Spo0J family partition protein [Ihubacter massiliensis]|uniref:ParB/RepB/Spo0J family partition protein n=1 Tax=Hominibacterium faecale TaxID=2839743 RepID=A0A9J6QMY2_9FIRM|nr:MULTISPECIES: ParB/RepB/Spo0J family partition protein [Eubacteriales Family XIII. Incertae Sedis]MCO7123038.1 ParB/RepB/Spo0J family partition protein [Ihubacter massiliensis]MCU7377298.1 ParB/RepB/Spo0J family partition protein [Hominibacterium faecale]
MLIKKVTEIPIDLIFANPEQPRKIFGEEELLELRDSIKEYGVIQPIILKRNNNGSYIVIAGERRLRAAGMAGLTKIPAIVREADDKDAAIIALVENVQRENLGYMEEAQAYNRLMEEFELTQGELAERVGKKQSTISNKIRLLSLPEDIQKALIANRLTERHARALLKIPDDETRKMVIDRIVSHGLNVRQSEKLIEDVLEKQQEEKRKQNKIRYISYKLYLNTIRKTFNEIFQVEQGAKYTQEDKGEYYEVKITIPKNTPKQKQVVNQ